MINFKLYSYNGPLYINDEPFAMKWRAETIAVDKRDAYNQIAMRIRYNITDFVDKNAKIVLPGKVMKVR